MPEYRSLSVSQVYFLICRLHSQALSHQTDKWLLTVRWLYLFILTAQQPYWEEFLFAKDSNEVLGLSLTEPTWAMCQYVSEPLIMYKE